MTTAIATTNNGTHPELNEAAKPATRRSALKDTDMRPEEPPTRGNPAMHTDTMDKLRNKVLSLTTRFGSGRWICLAEFTNEAAGQTYARKLKAEFGEHGYQFRASADKTPGQKSSKIYAKHAPAGK